MKKYYIIAFVICTLIWSATTFAADKTKVGILPFLIYSEEDLSYLQDELLEKVTAQLKESDLTVISGKSLGNTGLTDQSRDDVAMRLLGDALGVDYVLHGSLTKIGSSFSLDMRVVDRTGKEKTATVYEEVEGIENLTGAAKALAVKAALAMTRSSRVVSIIITGNQRVEDDAVLDQLESKEGEPFAKSKVSQDLKRIYKMNYFSDVQVSVEELADGKSIHFTVVEKPIIREIVFKGNYKLKEDELLDVLAYKLYSIVDSRKIVKSLENILSRYGEEGYYFAEVTYKLEDIEKQKVAITYTIKENRRIFVKSVKIFGNENIKSSKLKKAMKTKVRTMLSWLFDTGKLDREILDADTLKILQVYHNNGYLKAQIGEPEVKVEEKGISILINVNEGPQYRVGAITFSGKTLITEEELVKKMELRTGIIFSREELFKDMQNINSYYASIGYAYSSIIPQAKEIPEELVVDVNIKIDPKQLVYIERIDVEGNVRTRENVIRREFQIAEGDLYSAKKIRASAERLYRLDYFNAINFEQNLGSDDSKMNLSLVVDEKKTGTFSFGAGYSSYNKLFATASIDQKNLFGRGQKVKLEASVGSRQNEYRFSFMEPYLFDTTYSAGFSLFNTVERSTYYDKTTSGLSFTLGKPLFELVRIAGQYSLENNVISDMDLAAPELVQALGTNLNVRKLSFTLRRDSRDRITRTSKGSDNYIVFTYAGGLLGGDVDFNQYNANTSWYYPMPWLSQVFFIRGYASYIHPRDGAIVPSYERYFLGGLNTIRGYEWGSISPVDPETDIKIGGIKTLFFNVEYLIPLADAMSLTGVVFFDAGNTYLSGARIDPADFKKSVGLGIRFNSPMGAIRLEWGYALDRAAGERESVLEFGIGSAY